MGSSYSVQFLASVLLHSHLKHGLAPRSYLGKAEETRQRLEQRWWWWWNGGRSKGSDRGRRRMGRQRQRQRWQSQSESGHDCSTRKESSREGLLARRPRQGDWQGWKQETQGAH